MYHPPMQDLAGKRFGRRIAIKKEIRRLKNGRTATYWLCRCDCGAERWVTISSLNSGHGQSCGCLRNEVISAAKTIHGLSGGKSKVYGIWKEMRKRCLNKKHKSYSNYGGRGIKICERWHQFENFYADMGNPPPGFTLDRKDNELNYSPENCKWSNHFDQNRNRRTTFYVEINGTTKPLAQWCEEYGVLPMIERIRSRIKRSKWDPVESLTIPIARRL